MTVCGIETEVFDQSNIISANIIKEKKQTMKKIINDLPRCSEKYDSMNTEFRPFHPHEMLNIKRQSPFSLFSLFISSISL